MKTWTRLWMFFTFLSTVLYRLIPNIISFLLSNPFLHTLLRSYLTAQSARLLSYCLPPRLRLSTPPGSQHHLSTLTVRPQPDGS